MTPLLTFLAHCREPMTATGLWHDITTIRANGSPCEDLPASLSDLQRALRLLMVSGQVVQGWEADATEATWRPLVKVQKDMQSQLF